MTKTTELLKSRRLWVAVFSVGCAVMLHQLGAINGDKLATWVEMAVGIYAASLGIGHAAGAMGTSVARDEPITLVPMEKEEAE